MDPIDTKVAKAFDRIFPGLDGSGLKRGLHPWDSLKHLELLQEIESTCLVRLTLVQALKIDTLQAAIEQVVQSTTDLTP